MVTLEFLQRLDLRPRPRLQVMAANLVLRPDFAFPRRTEIAVEGIERISPTAPVFIAMNHTDRFNYFPFQVELYLQARGFTCPWTKAKYFRYPPLAWFLTRANGIPVPSRGYILATEFRRHVGSYPDPHEYASLTRLVDSREGDSDASPEPLPGAVGAFLSSYSREHPMGFRRRFWLLYEVMMAEVVRLTRRAFELGHHVLVFPEGTRAKRLTEGRTGLVQVAQHLGAPIVPVGCSGSDHLYPGNLPFSHGGRVLYRVGDALEPDGPEFAAHRVTSGIIPFTRDTDREFGQRYESMTNIVMDSIDALLEPEYRSDSDRETGSVEGLNRFV